MPALLGYCQTCKQPFEVRNIFGVEGAGPVQVKFSNCTIKCPLGHKAVILDGDYQLFKNSTRLISGPPLTREMFERVIKLLNESREDATAEEFVKKAGQIDPRLGKAVAAAAFIKHKGWQATAMAAVITLAHNCHGEYKLDGNRLIDQMRGIFENETHAPSQDHHQDKKQSPEKQSLPNVIKTVLHR